MKAVKVIAPNAYSVLGTEGLQKLGARWDNTTHGWVTDDEAAFSAAFAKATEAIRAARQAESDRRQTDWTAHNERQSAVGKGASFWVARADGIEILPSGVGYVRGVVGGQWKEAFGGSSRTTLLPVGTRLKVRWERSTSSGGNPRRSANVEVL